MARRSRIHGLFGRLAAFGRILPLCVAALLFTVDAAQLRSVDLDRLVDSAGDIVIGTCVEVETIAATSTEGARLRVWIDVERSIKGSLHDLAYFDMDPLVWEMGTRFTAGEQVFVFLYPPNQRGVRSPVALQQGRLRLDTAPDGRAVAVASPALQGLLRQLPDADRSALAPRTRAGGTGWDVSLDGLVELVERRLP